MLLACADITKTFGKGTSHSLAALDGVSLHVDAGERVGIVGPSGSGKSTLARVLARLQGADAGTVAFQGAVVPQGRRLARAERAGARAAWRDMQMVFQNPEASFSPAMTVGRGIAEGLAYREPKEGRRSREETRHAVLKAAEAVGLPAALLRRRAFELSGGQCQRAAIARAIVAHPRLVICDEPTSALDVLTQAQVVGVLRGLNADYGIAFVLISHDEALVNGFCDRCYRLERGRVAGEFAWRP